MITKMPRIILFFSLFFCLTADSVLAADFSIRPFLFDESLEPRDVVTRDITLTNETGRKINLYATVNEIALNADGEIQEFVSPVMTDRKTNPASWIEITRGRITLDPGESTTTPITFRINPQAVSGEYNVFVGFVDTNKRQTAEDAALNGNARGIPVKIVLEESIATALTITTFKIPRFIFNEDKAKVDLVVSNNGEVVETPAGEIIYYSSTGEELAATKLNSESLTVDPGAELSLPQMVPVDQKIGRFRANVTVTYGQNGNLSAYNTIDFFVIPLYVAIILFLTIIAFSVFVTYLLKKALDDHRIVVEEEIDLPFMVNTGYLSKEKDHDITITKN